MNKLKPGDQEAIRIAFSGAQVNGTFVRQWWELRIEMIGTPGFGMSLQAQLYEYESACIDVHWIIDERRLLYFATQIKACLRFIYVPTLHATL